jgi:hypothetical protein
MKAIRILLAAIVFAAAGFAAPASATSATTDQSDLWWIPTESGWGIQFVQRDTVIFATMFVYDPTNIPIWYTATLVYNGDFVWTGDLYLTSGPWFGTVPFNPNAVGQRKVGTMTWSATSITTGDLTYSVDGVAVAKSLTRQLLVYDNFSGRYGTIIHSESTGCSDPALNFITESTETLNVTQNGQVMTLTSSTYESFSAAGFSANDGNCTFAGTLTQAGQMGTVNGSYSCSQGETGVFQLYEMQVNTIGMTGLFTASANGIGCQTSGWFGGVRVVQPHSP